MCNISVWAFIIARKLRIKCKMFVAQVAEHSDFSRNGYETVNEEHFTIMV